MNPLGPSHKTQSKEDAQPTTGVQPSKSSPADAARIIQETETKPKTSKTFTLTQPIPDDMPDIWKAAAKGEWDEVEKLMGKNASFNVNAAPAGGMNGGKTVAWFAAKQGSWDLVEKFMKIKGMDPNISPQEGEDAGKTLLWMAVVATPQRGELEATLEGALFTVARQLLNDPRTDKNAAPMMGVHKDLSVSWMILALKVIGQGLDFFPDKTPEEVFKSLQPDITLSPKTELDPFSHLSSKSCVQFFEEGSIQNDTIHSYGTGDFHKLIEGENAYGQKLFTNFVAGAVELEKWDIVYAELKKHPDDFCKGVSSKILTKMIEKANKENKPLVLKALLKNEAISLGDVNQHLFFSNPPEMKAAIVEASQSRSLDPGNYNSPPAYIEFGAAMREMQDIIASDYGTNPFQRLPLELKLPIIREALRSKLDYVNFLSDDALIHAMNHVMVKANEETKKQSVEWLLKRTYGVLKADIIGIGGPKTSDVSYKDFKKLWNQAIENVEKKHNRDLMINQDVRDKLVDAFQEIELPLTRRKLEDLISKVCQDQLR